ncbi:MAG: 2TM domain-containing protein [Methanomassiliicoccales archaeon]|nr:2TM domain-containing protein [Methanomassiliicoccales archaeon]
MVEDEELLVRARKKAEAKLTFYTDLSLYSIVNVFLFALWWNGGGGFPWFLFVVFFWGLGVISHGLVLFRQSNWFDKMTETEYQRELKRVY